MNGAPWGGSEELWYRTAMHLATSGAKVGCAVYHWPEKEIRLQLLEEAGCTVYRLPNKKTAGGRFLVKSYRKQQAKEHLKKRIAQLPIAEYDLVVVNQGGLEIITTPWKDLYRQLPRYVLLFHNYNEADEFSATQKANLQAWISGAEKNLFAAAKAKEVLQKQINVTIKQAAVFINPISFPAPTSPAAFPSLKKEGHVLSVFAALDVQRKGQDKLVRLLALPKWKERAWQLHLYGEGKDHALLQKMIREAGLEQKVFLKGHTSDVAAAMRETHIILQATNVDAMPLSVMEAMAIGRPLIVTVVGDMPLWVREGINGWVCSSEEYAIDNCLEKAWQNRHEWEQMGRLSFEIFQEKFPKNVEASFLNQLP